MTPARAFWETKGIEEYLENLAKAGQNIDQAAERAVVAGGEIVLNSQLEAVPVGKAPEDRHPGQLKSHIKMSAPVHDGNTVSVDIGVEKEAPAEVHVYGGVQEYGSSSNHAQPYIRPSLDRNKARILAAERGELEKAGVL